MIRLIIAAALIGISAPAAGQRIEPVFASGLNRGTNAVVPPTTLYRYPIGAKAVRC